MPEEHLSTENINEILDKLIQQTQQINETAPNADIQDLTPIVETHTDNDSNIYYIKTYMPPRINFKSSSENLHATRYSNKTDQSREVSNEVQSLTSDDEIFPGANKITRKTINYKQFAPRLIHKGQESVNSDFKPRSGLIDEHENSLDDLIKKEMVAELNTTNNTKQTSSGHQNPQLSLLHQYPEIIIDHITYDNDENDKKKIPQIKSTLDVPHVQNAVKEETNDRLPNMTPRKIRYNIPEEEIEMADDEPPEYFEPRDYFTPDMNGLIDAIVQKKVMHDALLKQTTENESRKQNILLQRILQRLPEKRQMINNVKSSYTVRHERIAPIKIETLSHLLSAPEPVRRSGGNHLPKSYLNVPHGHSKWEIHNRLLKTLVRMYRPEILKSTRVVAGLIDRIVPNIGYRPVYYDLYKK